VEPTGWSTFSAIDPAFAEAMDVDRRAAGLGFDASFRPPRGRAEFQQAMLGNAFQEAADVVRAFGAVHGTEVRDPTFDRRVVEWAFRIPPEQYRRGGERRWLQKRLLAGQAPPALIAGTRGHQAADARLRIGADLGRVRSDIEALATDPGISRMFDVDRLRSAVEADDRWIVDQDPKDLGDTIVWLSRAVATARFVRSVHHLQPARTPATATVDARETEPVDLRDTRDERPRATR
jgi:asparagine synthase (glutamine-hydrolysing)